MPFLPYNEEDEEKKGQGQQGPQNISGEGTSFNTEPAGSPQASKPTKNTSGQYTNINQYIGANTDQARDMGTKLTSQVENQAEKATQGINNLNQQVVKHVDLDPTNYLESPDQYRPEEYQKAKETGGYEGPSNISEVKGINNTAKQADNASQQVQALGSESGIDSILQNEYKRPDYNRGQLSLDNALVRSDEQNVNDINNLQKKYAGINSLFSDTATNVGNSINEANTQAFQNKEKFLPAEQAAWERLVNPIQDRVDQYNQTKDDKISSTYDDIHDDTINQQTLDTLGLNYDDIQGNLYNIDLNKYLTQDSTQAGLNNLAEAEERARYAALAQLIGDESRTQIQGEGETLTPISFNQEEFLQDRANLEQEYNTKISDLTNAYNSQVLPSVKQGFDDWSDAFVFHTRSSQDSDLITALNKNENFSVPLNTIRNAGPNTPKDQILNAINQLSNELKKHGKTARTIEFANSLSSLKTGINQWNNEINNTNATYKPDRILGRG